MPITKSAKKALRQNKKRRIKNSKDRKKLRELIKKVRVLVSEKKADEAKKMVSQLYKALDKGIKTGLIKKNTASRKKSRLTKLVNKG
jgi:small subunit ribosomal protein S20